MRHTLLRGALLACCCVGIAAGAAAQVSDEYARPGLYLGLSGTYAIEEFDDGGFGADDSWGLNLRGGFRVNPYVAAEIEYEYLAGFDLDAASGGGEVEGFSVMANGRAIAPLGRVEPYLLVGLGALALDLDRGGRSRDRDGFAARFGGGLDFYLTENVVARMEGTYVVPAGDAEDFDYGSISWGFLYRF